MKRFPVNCSLVLWSAQRLLVAIISIVYVGVWEVQMSLRVINYMLSVICRSSGLMFTLATESFTPQLLRLGQSSFFTLLGSNTPSNFEIHIPQ